MSTFQELCEAVFAGKTIQYKSRTSEWVSVNDTAERVISHILAHESLTYRIKPNIKVITYRIYLDVNLVVQVSRNIVSQVELESAPVFITWLGAEQTIEVEL